MRIARIICFWIAVVILWSSSAPTTHAGIDVTGGPLTPLTTFGQPGGGTDGQRVAIVGHWAYNPAGEALITIDLSNTNSPRIVSQVPTTMAIHTAVADDGRLYAAGAKGFVVFDLSDPAKPVLRSSYFGLQSFSKYYQDVWNGPPTVSIGKLLGVYMARVWLVVLGCQNGWCFGHIEAVDVSDADHPRLAFAGSQEVTDTRSRMGQVAMGGGRLFIFETAALIGRVARTLSIYPIDYPSVGGGGRVDCECSNIKATPERAYVSHDKGNGESLWLEILDVTDPYQVRSIAQFEQIPPISELGDHRGVILKARQLWTVDLAKQDQPVVRAKLDLSFDPYSVVLGGTLAVVVEVTPDGRRLHVVDLKRLDRPSLKGALEISDVHQQAWDVRAIGVSGSLAVIGSADGRLGFLDASQPANLRLVGELHMPFAAEHIHVSGQQVFWSAGLELSLVDATDPARPQPADHMDLDADMVDFAAFNGRAVLAMPDGLRVVVMDQGGKLREAGRYPLPGIRSVAIDGVRVAAVTQRGVSLFDLTSSAEPLLLGFIDVSAENLSAQVKVTVSGRFLFLMDKTSRAGSKYVDKTVTLVYDIGDADEPELLFTFQDTTSGRLSGRWKMMVAGDYVVDLFEDRLEVHDGYAPNDTPVQTIDGTGDGYELTIPGDLVWVAAGNGGLEIYQIQPVIPPTSQLETRCGSTSKQSLSVKGHVQYGSYPYVMQNGRPVWHGSVYDILTQFTTNSLSLATGPNRFRVQAKDSRYGPPSPAVTITYDPDLPIDPYGIRLLMNATAGQTPVSPSLSTDESTQQYPVDASGCIDVAHDWFLSPPIHHSFAVVVPVTNIIPTQHITLTIGSQTRLLTIPPDQSSPPSATFDAIDPGTGPDRPAALPIRLETTIGDKGWSWTGEALLARVFLPVVSQ